MESFKETIDFFSPEGVPLRSLASITLARQHQVFDQATSQQRTPTAAWCRQVRTGSATDLATVWASDERASNPDAPPFEIETQGVGVFGWRRSAWHSFNPRLKGFGAEEGYIQKKFRRAGGRVLCLPCLRELHRFGRPAGVAYRNKGLSNVLVLEDDVLFTGDVLPRPDVAIRELKGRDWNLFHPGACRWEHRFPLVEGCTHLEAAGPVICCHAIAYRIRLSPHPRRLAEGSPRDRSKSRFSVRDKTFLVSPIIAAQPSILSIEGESLKARVFAISA